MAAVAVVGVGYGRWHHLARAPDFPVGDVAAPVLPGDNSDVVAGQFEQLGRRVFDYCRPTPAIQTGPYCTAPHRLLCSQDRPNWPNRPGATRIGTLLRCVSGTVHPGALVDIVPQTVPGNGESRGFGPDGTVGTVSPYRGV